MSWKVETGTDGLPVWSGRDSVFNAEKDATGGRAKAMGANILVGGLIFLPISCIASSIGAGGMGAAFTMVVGAILFGAFVLINHARKPEFMTRDWTLAATGQGLVWNSGPFTGGLDPEEVSPYGPAWRVPFGEIARVETAATTEWQRARRQGGKPFAIASAEYQTYLFLADGSRRIIYTANGDREGTSTLAHSLRSWLGRATPAAPLDWREGFDV